MRRARPRRRLRLPRQQPPPTGPARGLAQHGRGVPGIDARPSGSSSEAPAGAAAGRAPAAAAGAHRRERRRAGAGCAAPSARAALTVASARSAHVLTRGDRSGWRSPAADPARRRRRRSSAVQVSYRVHPIAPLALAAARRRRSFAALAADVRALRGGPARAVRAVLLPARRRRPVRRPRACSRWPASAGRRAGSPAARLTVRADSRSAGRSALLVLALVPGLAIAPETFLVLEGARAVDAFFLVFQMVVDRGRREGRPRTSCSSSPSRRP